MFSSVTALLNRFSLHSVIMQFSPFLIWGPLAVVSISTYTSALQIPTQINARQQQINCKDPSTGLDSSCWNNLQLTSWLKNWNQTTTCNKGEIWTNCFIRLANKNPGTDCSVIGGNGCGPPSNNLPVSPSIEPQVYYVLYNIFG